MMTERLVSEQVCCEKEMYFADRLGEMCHTGQGI
jgi:hypothetical protein